MVVGDMLLKKQGRLYYEKNSNTSEYDDLVNDLNSWYSFSYDAFPIIKDSSFQDSIPVLFINNQYDIASPKELVESELLPFYPNSIIYNVQGTGHLDLFFDPLLMDSVQYRIIDFFYSQP